MYGVFGSLYSHECLSIFNMWLIASISGCPEKLWMPVLGVEGEVGWVMGSLSWLVGSQPMAGCLELDDLEGFFQPKPSHDPMIL